MRLYLLGTPRAATTYLNNLIGEHLLRTGVIESRLGEFFNDYGSDGHEHYEFDGAIRFCGIDATRIVWHDEMRRRRDWLCQAPSVFFKAFGANLFQKIDGEPVHDLLARLDFTPIIVQRRDVERQFLSYATIKAARNTFHADTVVGTDLVCPPQTLAAFVRHHLMLRLALYHVAPYRTVWVEDLTGVAQDDLALLGFARDAITHLPRRTVYVDDDPYRHFADPEAMRQMAALAKAFVSQC